MRVKHKDSRKEDVNMSMSLSHWHKEYLPNKKYLNYDFYDVPEIFDLYEIDQRSGSLTYVKSGFGSEIKPIVRQNPLEYVDKAHDQKYLDEYLMPRKSYQSGFLRKSWYSLPKLKTGIEKIINSTISREMWLIVRGVLILLTAYILWAIFGDLIVEHFK